MIFLNPSVLFGMLAASIPILIHLFNLRKLKKIEFSTLAFLKELQKTKIRKIKLKQWILLVLRVLIILLLVAAFARPTIESVSIGGTSSAAKTTAVFVIDNSISMSVVTEKGSYLNQGKQIAKSLISQFQDGDDITIIFPSEVTAESKIKTFSNPSLINEFLESTGISAVRGSIHNAIVSAGQILAESDNFNKEIYILWDFQKDGLYSSKEILSNLEPLFGENVRLYTFDFYAKDPANLSVTSLVPNNQIFEKEKQVGFTATISNYSASAFSNTVASLFINGKRSAQQSFDITPGGTKQLTFETTLKEAGLLDIFVELEEDDIASDNTRYLSLDVPEKINLLLLSDNSNDTRFVKLAVKGLSSGNIELTEKNTNQVNSLNFDNYNAVMIVGNDNISNYERIKSYCTNSGNILFLPGENSSLQSLQKFSNSFGLPAPTLIAGNLNSISSPASFEKIDYEHPIFINLFEKQKTPRIESPDIYRFLKVKTAGSGKQIINLIDNSSFLSESKIGTGKILFYNTAPVLSWSNLPIKSIFPPLILKSILYLTNTVDEVKGFTAGEGLQINLGKAKSPQIRVLQPGNNETIVNLDSINANNYWNFADTKVTGTYKFYSGNSLIDFAPVNTDPLESKIEHISTVDFEKYLDDIHFNGRYLNLSPEEDYLKSIYQSRFGSELWKYFLSMALLLALIEMLISKSAKKDMAEV
ncbi:MAG: VWA domain-containing protein [bacterium]